MNNYDKVLEICKSSDSEDGFLNFPFSIGEYVYASNGSIICQIPKHLVSIKVEEIKDNKIISSVLKYEYSKPTQLIVDKAKLIELAVNWEFVMCYEEIECEACEGEGTVEAQFHWKRKSFTIEGDCPVCKGEGFLEDKTKPQYKQYDMISLVAINKVYFGEKTIIPLFECLALFPEENLFIENSGEIHGINIFKLGDISFGIMPCIGRDEVTIGNINVF